MSKSQNKNTMDVKHPPVMAKCKFGEKCVRPLTCKFQHDFKNNKKGLTIHPKKNNKPMAHTAKSLRTALKSVLPMAKMLHEKKCALLREKAETESKYHLVDNKGASIDPYAAKLAAVEDEIKAMRQLARIAIGGNHVTVPLVEQLMYACVITTGVTSANTAIVASGFVDFASAFALVFEEYRFTKGVYTFESIVPAATSITTPSTTGPTFGVLSYSDIITALTSVVSGTDDVQHILVKQGNITGGASEAYESIQHFHFKIPSGVLDDATVSGAGNWTLTSNSSVVWGYLKSYMVSATAVVQNTIGGILNMTCEFRMRQ